MTGPVVDTIQQFQIFSASPGKFAANVSERRTGRFTEALFDQFRGVSGAGWPDFAVSFDRAKVELQRLGLGEQEPYVVTESPGRGRSFMGTIPGRSAAPDRLRTCLAKHAAAPELLYVLYRRSLPPTAAARPLSSSTDALLRDLKDCRPKADNLPGPLVEFAERAGREFDSQAIRKWVDDDANADPFARARMRVMLDAEDQKARDRATLFVELEGLPPTSLRWWIHAPEPAMCTGPTFLRPWCLRVESSS